MSNVKFFFRVEKILASLVGISVQLGEVVRQGIIIIQIGIIITTNTIIIATNTIVITKAVIIFCDKLTGVKLHH